MSKKYVIANFKMNKTNKQISEYLDTFIPLVKDADAKVGLIPNFVALSLAAQKTADTNILIGAQNMNENEKGTFTGEISSDMIIDAGAKLVLLGHSERRQKYNETDALVNQKLLRALKVNLVSILCIGESLQERNSGLTESVLDRQLSQGLKDVYSNEFKNIIIAYEPIWSISPGKLPTMDQVRDAMATIRSILTRLYSKELAQKATILYGGSVDDINAKDFAKIKGVDGALVGGASLDPIKFSKVVQGFSKKS